MKEIQLKDAKATLSAVVDQAIAGEPAVITRHGRKAAVVLSGYPSPLYDRLFEGWHRHEKATWTGQGNGRAERTEVAWVNRPPGDEVLASTGTEDCVFPPANDQGGTS